MIRIMRYGEEPNQEIFARAVPEVDVSAVVSEILSGVRLGGDRALLDYTEKFDRVRPESLSVTKEEFDEAVASVDPDFLRILEQYRRSPDTVTMALYTAMLNDVAAAVAEGDKFILGTRGEKKQLWMKMNPELKKTAAAGTGEGK